MPTRFFGLIAAVWLAVILSSANTPSQRTVDLDQHSRPEDTEQRLVGVWLREDVQQGVASRRILRLEANGTFEEHVLLRDPSDAVSEHRHAGTWVFDGTNLKRKYTLMNGQPPSRLNLPFATFSVQFPTRHEWVGTDHIHRRRVTYRRVSPETAL